MKLNDISLDKFKVIYSLTETKSISATAHMLFVTPSAISQSLVTLEDQLDKQLFIRQGKVLQPTQDCQKLIQIYEPFHHSLESFLSDSETKGLKPKGELRIFMPGSAGPKILSKPFSEFLEKYNEVNFVLDGGSSPNAIRSLYNNSVDFAFCGIKKLVDQHKWCTAVPLFDLSMNLYCSKSFYEKNKSAIKNGNYLSLPHVSGYKNQNMLKWYFQETLGKTSMVTCRVSVYDMNYMTKAVSHGLGLGLLAEELIKDEIKSGEVIQVGKKTLKHPIFLIYQKQKSFSPCEKVFKEFIVSYFN